MQTSTWAAPGDMDSPMMSRQNLEFPKAVNYELKNKSGVF